MLSRVQVPSCSTVASARVIPNSELMNSAPAGFGADWGLVSNNIRRPVASARSCKMAVFRAPKAGAWQIPGALLGNWDGV